MKKLNATDIKGIIEDRGSNIFDVIIDVPKNIFAYPEFQQADIVVEAILGYKLKSRIVKSILFNGIPKTFGSINVKSTLEFTNAAIIEMTEREKSISELSSNAHIINDLLTIEDAIELANKGVDTFVVSLSKFAKNKSNIELSNYVSEMIVSEVELKELTITPSPIKSNDPNGYWYTNVTVSNLKEQLEKALVLKTTLQTIIEKINPFAEVLEKPLDQFDIESIAEEQLAEMEIDEEQPDYVYHNFNYLVEVAYDDIVEADDNSIVELISRLIIDEEMLELEFVELSHQAAGFNPISKKVILAVEGGLAIPL